MEKLTSKTEQIMNDRFGCDNVIALATAEDNIPHVRGVNAYYENGAFYIITYAMSDKMKQIGKNPIAAVSGEWFTAHGRAESLGYIGSEDNADIADKLKAVFGEWIDNGHVDFFDENTIILRVKLTDGVLFADGVRYDIDFENSL
ncbi:MAG: pyridoxamine 5'-phosphate oxidase family protein [Oscillospiraceae bacterium]|nr:pyridoxamine 5'-phosphate oxidase family protein [Oscillospiraceae bacterium]MDY2847872.1 pyridoxamine 5'-phosphate oxidase family protein [Oscillospiraceae bacterium]